MKDYESTGLQIKSLLRKPLAFLAAATTVKEFMEYISICK